MKNPLQNLAAKNENWSEHTLSAGEWKLVEGAVKLLKPVRDTIKIWEGEKHPTMHRVVDRVYTMESMMDDFVKDPANNQYGKGFARELKSQIQKRFPNKGTDNNLRRMANYLAPQFKGIHLETENKMVLCRTAGNGGHVF